MRHATAQEIAQWNIDVSPDGTGLPSGSGTVQRGTQVFETNCQACHRVNGQGGIGGRLAGGQGTFASADRIKTVGFWPYATMLFDYVHRAMPYPKPGSLSADDTYAVVAYILNLNHYGRAVDNSTGIIFHKLRCPTETVLWSITNFAPTQTYKRDCNSDEDAG